MDEIEPLINNINEQNKHQKRTKNKHFYIPFLPRMYWLFYRDPINLLILIPSLTEGWCNMAVTIFMGNIIDGIHKENGMEIVKNNSLYALLTAFICALLTSINYSMWFRIGDLVGVKIKRLLFKSLMEKDIEFFDKNTIGHLIVLLQQDCSTVTEAFTDLKTHQISCVGKFFAALIGMFSVDYKMAIFSLICSFSIIFIVRILRKIGSLHYLKFRNFLSQSITISDESISNEKVVFSFNRQKEQVNLFEDKLCTAAEHDSKSRFYLIFSYELSAFIIETCSCVILNIGSFFVLKGKISSGSLFTLSRAAIWTGREFNHFVDTLKTEERAIDSSNRIFDIIDFPVEIKDENFSDEMFNRLESSFVGKVEFKNVWFKYPTRDVWILKNVSFVTEPNQITAIVGHSGSGKSTIVQLLLRFYDVDQGEILIDNINIKKYPLKFLHKKIGVVQQDPRLFTLSIKENIIYSNVNATDEEVMKAARIANADVFINELPEKYNTLCGEKGTFLSGGQIQRIAIARVVIENPALLITDEATSALDAESESLVQDALEKVMKGRTSIIIAHRLGTIRAATKIYVFDQGSIVEQGTHDELLSLKGAFYRLVQRQLT